MDFTPVQAQMSAEWRNHAAYASMAAKLYAAKWDGFASHFEKLSGEELEHYKMFRDYLIDRQQIPALMALEVPPIPNQYTPLDCLRMAYALEKANTASIFALDAMSEENEGDAEREFLETFLIPLKNEQRQSERDASDSVIEVGRVSNDPAGMELMNDRYGERAGR